MSVSRVYASFKHAAKVGGVHQSTIRNWVARGDLAAFKLPGQRGHFVDLNEAKALAAKRAEYGAFGPDAKVIDLSKVVGDFEVAG
jgi:hypothetical protein